MKRTLIAAGLVVAVLAASRGIPSLSAAGAAPKSEKVDFAGGVEIVRWHDAEKPVTCWLASAKQGQEIAISCLPDLSVHHDHPSGGY